MRRMILLAAVTAALLGGTAGSAQALLTYTAQTTGCTTTVLGILSIGCTQTIAADIYSSTVTTTYGATVLLSGQPTTASCTEYRNQSNHSASAGESFILGCKLVVSGQPLLTGSCQRDYASYAGVIYSGLELCKVTLGTTTCTVHISDQHGTPFVLGSILASIYGSRGYSDGQGIGYIIGPVGPIFLPTSVPTGSC